MNRTIEGLPVVSPDNWTELLHIFNTRKYFAVDSVSTIEKIDPLAAKLIGSLTSEFPPGHRSATFEYVVLVYQGLIRENLESVPKLRSKTVAQVIDAKVTFTEWAHDGLIEQRVLCHALDSRARDLVSIHPEVRQVAVASPINIYGALRFQALKNIGIVNPDLT